jgi:hypothetical protein
MKNEAAAGAVKVGDKVTCNGHEGTVVELPSWAPGLAEVRMARGSVMAEIRHLVAR